MNIRNIGNIVHDNQIIRSQLASYSANLNVMHFNSQSLCINPSSSKLSEIRNIVEDSLLDIVGISETWLKPNILTSAANFSGYSFCRNDRPDRRGGGVGYGTVECLFCEIATHTETFLVGVVYLPTGDFQAFEDEVSCLLARYRSIVLMGDFNSNLFDTRISVNVRRSCTRLGLAIHHNNRPTHFDPYHQSSSLIDFFMTSLPQRIVHSDQVICPSISKHAFVYISINVPVRRHDEFYEFVDYTDFNSSELHDRIMSTDFSGIYNSADVNEQLHIFVRGLDIVHSFFKKKTKKVHYSRDNWINSAVIRHHQSMADLAYRAYLDERNDRNWRVYCRHRNRTKAVKRSIKRRMHHRLFGDIRDSKSLWRIVKENGVGNGSDRHLGSDFGVDTLNHMNESFADNQIPVCDNVEDFLRDCDDIGFSFRCIDSTELIDAFRAIKSNVAGTDGFPLHFFKIVFPYITNEFLCIVNTIIMTSTFPICWKTAKITPIRKKGNQSGDFRPIALLPVLSKVVENVLKSQILTYIENRSLLHDCQCGFRSGRSTSALLLGLTDSVRHTLANNRFSVLLSLDLEKAFDRVVSVFHMHMQMMLRFFSAEVTPTQILRCLGIVIDDRLTFEEHIDNVVARTVCGIRQLYNIDLVLPRFVRERLVHALIMPNIIYCLEVYSGTSDIIMRRSQPVFPLKYVYILSLCTSQSTCYTSSGTLLGHSFTVRTARLFNALPSTLRVFNSTNATYRKHLLQYCQDLD
ncbi:uncharacterized protein LOC142222506 [Haematobia irritans]|uniref:uncharacterized protein LOC142222506 n=1 Tax=Haematobia irritans TaxID=7368 RepID=UPI003F4F62CB